MQASRIHAHTGADEKAKYCIGKLRMTPCLKNELRIVCIRSYLLKSSRMMNQSMLGYIAPVPTSRAHFPSEGRNAGGTAQNVRQNKDGRGMCAPLMRVPQEPRIVAARDTSKVTPCEAAAERYSRSPIERAALKKR